MISNTLVSKYTFVLFLLVVSMMAHGQVDRYKNLPQENVASVKAQYEANKKKARIRGVYIPKNIDEACAELRKLSSPQGLMKFRKAPEEVIAHRLHFGLGKWIAQKWNFSNGSRYIEHLKSLGLKDMDHFIQFTIVSFHRHLNNKPQEVKERVKAYDVEIQKKIEALKSRSTTTTVKRKLKKQ